MSEKPKTLDDVYDAIRLLSNSNLFRHPTLKPFPPLKLHAIYGGSTISNKLLTLGAGQTVEILRWEHCPAHLFMTVLGVSFLDNTLPFVGYVVNFDRHVDVLDWTVEEYNTTLGLGPLGVGIVPEYGGCSLYNAVTFQYACLTQWDYLTDDYLQIFLTNYTGVPCNLDVLDIQFWSTGDLSHMKFEYWTRR
jgi:hypothetical protein